MYKSLSSLFLLFFSALFCYAQKWQPGRFTDIKGNIESGLIRVNPSGKAPIKDEGFIEFREDKKTGPFKLSASDLKSFVVGQDSFVVAHAPQNETWPRSELDFVKVVLNEDPVKLYAANVGAGDDSGFGFSPGISTGIGSGGYGGFGAGFGGGISIPIGHGRKSGKTTWYFGENTAEMKRLTNDNFEDIMTDIMGDYPDVVDKIHAKVYVLTNIDKLIAYFKRLKAADLHGH